MSDTRLIERWLPITEIGIESLRERTPMTPFPAPNRLHVWWARRPLVASRAAILASVTSKPFLTVPGKHTHDFVTSCSSSLRSTSPSVKLSIVSLHK